MAGVKFASTRIRAFALLFALLLTVVFFGFVSFKYFTAPAAAPAVEPTAISAESIEALQSQVQELRQELSALKATPGVSRDADTAKLQTQVNAFDDRLSAIEKSLLDNPQRALELPLLRQQVESLQNMYKTDSQNMREEINRIYDLMKWFIGLMFTMTLALISVAVSNFWKRSSRGDEDKHTGEDMADAPSAKIIILPRESLKRSAAKHISSGRRSSRDN